jgi:hypothetical protein
MAVGIKRDGFPPYVVESLTLAGLGSFLLPAVDSGRHDV